MIISMLFCLILFSDVFLSKLVFSKRVHLLVFLENDVIQAQIQGVGQTGQVKQLVAHFIFYDGSAMGHRLHSWESINPARSSKVLSISCFFALFIRPWLPFTTARLTFAAASGTGYMSKILRFLTSARLPCVDSFGTTYPS